MADIFLNFASEQEIIFVAAFFWMCSLYVESLALICTSCRRLKTVAGSCTRTGAGTGILVQLSTYRRL